MARGRHRDAHRSPAVAALGAVRPAPVAALEPRAGGAARRRRSCHASHQGQGANQAIEDAAILAAELDVATDLPAALRRYEDRRRVRTRQVQAASWAASAALRLPDGPTVPSRDNYLAHLGERLAWIHGHDVLAPHRQLPVATGTAP